MAVYDMDQEKISILVQTYSSMLYRICLVMLNNPEDAEDAVQECFCRYLEKNMTFMSKNHEKAWMITVASNICRDMLRFRLRHPKVDIDEVVTGYLPEESSRVLEELMNLPSSVRSVVYLHYIEGYKITEISKMLKISDNAVKKRLQRGRQALRIRLEDGTE